MSLLIFHFWTATVLALYFKMLPVAPSGLVLICNIFEETYFCHSSGFSYISYLFPLRRFRTVETIPILKSRDDGVDMRFRNS